MSQRHPHAHVAGNLPEIVPPLKKHWYVKKRAIFWASLLPLIILSGLLVNWVFLAQLAFAAPLAPTAQSGNLTFQQYANEGQQNKASQSFVRPPEEKPKKSRVQPALVPSAEPASMEPMIQTLTNDQTDATMVKAAGVQPLDFISSDGRFEVQVPSGALDLSHAQTSQGTAPSGTLILQISQVSGHSAGLVNVLGEYQIQVLDSQNKPLTHLALRVPITILPGMGNAGP